MWAGADVTSIKRAGRITTLGFAVGAGLLIASGAGAAAASAAPDASAHTATSSASSARSVRPSTGTAARNKPAKIASVRGDSSAHVVQLRTTKRATPAASAPAVSSTVDVAAVPTASAKQAAPKRLPALPTPDQALQTITDGLGTVRSRLDDLRDKIQTLVQNQIIGFQNNLETLRIDLDRLFHPNRQLIYGNLANAQYFAVGGAQTANLMAAAMVISALTGQIVTAQDIVNEAMETDSVTTPGEKMYSGPTTFDWVSAGDAVQLLETHGVKVNTVSFSKSQGAQAWNSVVDALSSGKSVIVAINGLVGSSREGNTQQWTVEHQVVLVGINISKDVVYLNDGAYPLGGGQNMTMSIDDFRDAWANSRYTAVFAELAPATAQAASSDESIAA